MDRLDDGRTEAARAPHFRWANCEWCGMSRLRARASIKCASYPRTLPVPDQRPPLAFVWISRGAPGARQWKTNTEVRM